MSKSTITPDKFDALAVELIEFIQKNNMFFDVNIYVHDDRLSSNKHQGDITRNTKYGEFYVTENIDVRTILTHCNPHTITVTFEGPLNDEINYGNGHIKQEINEIFAKYDLYIEQGYAWSFAAYYN